MKMLKVFTRIGPALLAPALLIFAAASARAQGSNEVRPTPDVPDAVRVAATNNARKQRGADAARANGSRAPLTADQKISRSLRSAFLRPAPYLLSAFNAGITEWREDKPAGKTRSEERRVGKEC